MSEIKGALFDLDGVIVDSEPLYTEFWAELGRTYKLPSPTFAYDIKGTTLTDILTTHFPDERIAAEVKERIHQFEDTMRYPIFPGALEFIAHLRSRGIRTAIVTSSDSVKMSYLFKQHPRLGELFDVIVNGSMVSRSKPDPEGYLTAARLIDCPIEQCCVFEDSLQGLQAGRRAGAKVVALATTNPREVISPLADIVLDSFEGITSASLQ